MLRRKPFAGKDVEQIYSSKKVYATGGLIAVII
jgi:hypothetical protein